MAIRLPISSRVSSLCVLNPSSRCNCSRLFAISRASCSLSITWKMSPACGAPFKPKINAGADGPASLIRAFRSLNMALTRPWCVPARTISPVRRVPFSTNTVATYPRPLSRVDSITEPVALRSGLLLSRATRLRVKLFRAVRARLYLFLPKYLETDIFRPILRQGNSCWPILP